MATFDRRQVVRIRYTNYRGEVGVRRIIPGEMRFAANEWHPAPQWLLDAFDLDKEAVRSFAVKDIHEWMPEDAGECDRCRSAELASAGGHR
jgi:predicted DNA-binding transcriptional regulator YafY